MKNSTTLLSKRVLVSVFQAVVVLSVVGCSSAKLEPTPAAPSVAASTTPPSANANQPSSQTTVKSVVIHPLDDPQSPLKNRTVYFELDSAQVPPTSGPLLDEHGKYIRAQSSAKIRLEGHTDERGGREYNLALGQKRADSVAKALTLLGVASTQIDPISYGKEKPAATEHDEAAWAKNRKVDIVYQSR